VHRQSLGERGLFYPRSGARREIVVAIEHELITSQTELGVTGADLLEIKRLCGTRPLSGLFHRIAASR
jgi:hypothetical protein